MEHAWLFYALFFIFGHVTCKTFYFLNAARKSIGLLHATQVVALFIVVRALEHLHYAKESRLFTMKQNKASEQNIAAITLQFEDEMKYFKTKFIKYLIEAHGNFFNQTLEFADWEGAMAFLEGNKKHVEDLITRE